MNIMSNIGRSKYTDWALSIVSLGMMIAFGLILYWSLANYNVLEELEGNYQIDKTVYTQGERFDIHLRICKNDNIREDVYGRFVDGVIYSVPENTSNFDIGCYDTIINSISIPDSLPEGTYSYSEDIVYKVNPIKEITYRFTTPEFTVVDD